MRSEECKKLLSLEAESFMKRVSGTVLLTSREVIGHYYHIRQILSDTEPNSFKKLPSFNDIKEVVKADVTTVRHKASLPTIKSRSILTKLKKIVEKLAGARKRTAKLHLPDVTEVWSDKVFDISKCRCPITVPPQTYKNKLQCKCSFDHRVPAAEIEFLLDQRSSKKMVLSSRNINYARRRQNASNKAKRRKITSDC